MGVPRTLPAISISTSEIQPVYSGTVIQAESFSITNGIATIVLGASNLPTNGYNGPNGYKPNADIHGGINVASGAPSAAAGASGGPAGGQQVTLWGFSTGTYFNGVTVSVIDNNPANGSFRFYFDHANVNSTDDTGNTAASPFQHYRAVRIEADLNNSGTVYVGDKNVSSSQYVAALSPTGQLAIEIASQNIPADRIFIIGTNSDDSVHVSLIY